jgi:hypothetical protein
VGSRHDAPTDESRVFERVRIYVNSVVVADEERDVGAMNVVLRAETVIPLETSPPDTLGSEGLRRGPGG